MFQSSLFFVWIRHFETSPPDCSRVLCKLGTFSDLKIFFRSPGLYWDPHMLDFCLLKTPFTTDIISISYHNHISYIICHILFIIYLISYILYHISYIIYHISYIIYHISCIMYHISYIIYHISFISYIIYIIYHLYHILYHINI